jgi:adenylate cyclase
MRFVRTFGVSFFWATVIGLALGGAAWVRLERRELVGDPRWHVLPRLWLEELEWRTVDWRARELAGEAERDDGVVLVTIDEETLANAQESSHPEWAMRPWPRELLGDVAAQAIAEGAALVVIDQAFDDVSPRQCTPCRGEAAASDDQRFAERLAKLGPKVILGLEQRAEARRPPERPLLPMLVRVGEVDSEAAALPLLGRVLTQRTTAYLAPRASGGFEVWAGATNDARVKELQAAFELKGAPVTRSLTPADDDQEITRDVLLRRLVGAQLGGLEGGRAVRAAGLEAPVAPLLLPGVGLASLSLTPDPDGVLRQVPLLGQVGRSLETQATVPSVALLAGARLAGVTRVAREPGVVRLGDSSLAVDDDAFLSLRWGDDEVGRAGRGTLKRSVPAWRLLVNRQDDAEDRGVRHHNNELQGKVVVLTDEHGSPRYTTPVGPLSRGAIWGQAIANVRAGGGVTRVRPETDFWLTLAFAFAGALLAVAWSSLVRRPGWLAWVATIGLVFVVHALLARQLYVTQLRQVAVVVPVLACGVTFLASLGYARTLEKSLRDFVLRALGGAVRADVFSRVERDLALMRPERRELTVFFSDIEGFTAVSDSQEPAVVVEVLRQYLAEMTTVVLDRGGHVDKYLGDGLMAFWGAPVAQANDAAAACQAALEMLRHFEERRADWEERCGRPILLRSGIETGPAVVGEMGTVHRVNYTVMGEPVAMAFRLEALAKKYDVRVLVGERVVQGAGAGFVFRPVDRVRLGRAEAPVDLFELLGSAEEFAGETWVDDFRAAHAAFRERRFGDALEGFKKLQQARPADGLVARYVRRAGVYAATPPLDDWDGVTDDSELG